MGISILRAGVQCQIKDNIKEMYSKNSSKGDNFWIPINKSESKIPVHTSDDNNILCEAWLTD